MAKYRPWQPVTVCDKDTRPALNQVSETEVRCLRLITEGAAQTDEQKIAFNAIMRMCGVDDLEFLPAEHGGERETAFKSGKRFVGLQLRKLTTLPLNLLTGEQNER